MRYLAGVWNKHWDHSFKDLPGLYLDHKELAENKSNKIKFESGLIFFNLIVSSFRFYYGEDMCFILLSEETKA